MCVHVCWEAGKNEEFSSWVFNARSQMLLAGPEVPAPILLGPTFLGILWQAEGLYLQEMPWFLILEPHFIPSSKQVSPVYGQNRLEDCRWALALPLSIFLFSGVSSGQSLWASTPSPASLCLSSSLCSSRCISLSACLLCLITKNARSDPQGIYVSLINDAYEV